MEKIQTKICTLIRPDFIKGYEASRSEMDRWKILHSAKDLKQKRRNVKRSADVSGNARHFCDCELNFTGCEHHLPLTFYK